METHIQFEKVWCFWTRLGFSVVAIEKALGHIGGLWVLSSSSSFSYSLVAFNSQAISFFVYLSQE